MSMGYGMKKSKITKREEILHPFLLLSLPSYVKVKKGRKAERQQKKLPKQHIIHGSDSVTFAGKRKIKERKGGMSTSVTYKVMAFTISLHLHVSRWRRRGEGETGCHVVSHF